MAADAARTAMADLRDLEPTKEKLNTATEGVNVALQAIQDKLNAIGLGIEVFLDEPIQESVWRDILDRNNEPSGSRERDIVQLGYGRLGDGWALVVRYCREIESQNQYGTRETELTDLGESKPLLRASRLHRFAAVPRLQNLIDELESEAKLMIELAAKAKKIAESLK